MIDRMNRNREIKRSLEGRFYEIFGIELDEFWVGNLLGFNIFAFDAYMNMVHGVHDDISIEEFIQKTYGDEARGIIEQLCKRGFPWTPAAI